MRAMMGVWLSRSVELFCPLDCTVDRYVSKFGNDDKCARRMAQSRALPIFELPNELQSLVVGHMPLRTMARLARTLGA